MGTITKSLAEKQSFGTYVRIVRIFLIVMRRHLESMLDEVEKALDLLTRSLEADSENPWKRVVSMEFFRNVYSDFGFLRRLYAYFDKIENRKKIIGNSMSAFVRLASENPALIGLSHQSTIPHAREPTKESEEQAAIDALGITGVVSSTASAEASVTGISMGWSKIQVPCIDQPERSTAPPIPDTYVYSLVIDCLAAFSDGLARFIMPLSVPRDSRPKRQQQISSKQSDGNAPTEEVENQKLEPGRISRQLSGRKYQMLVNPLTIEKLPQLEEVKISVVLIESCWPAYLATSSTFLYAALDGEFYHSLIRSFQKLTQVSGILGLSTPRDALLTSLGKAAIPSDGGNVTSPLLRQRSARSKDDSGTSGKGGQLLSVLSPTLQSPTAESPRQSIDQPRSSLSTRNLLCLRALLNLGIALGPTLNEDAWSILIETLQQAENVINIATQIASRRSSSTTAAEDNILPKSNMGNELIAVQTATSRMFESTKDYPSNSFLDLVSALLRLTGLSTEEGNGLITEYQPSDSNPPMLKRGRMHQASRSVSVTLGRLKAHDAEVLFVIDKCRLLCLANMQRFASSHKIGNIWSKIIHFLLDIMKPTSSAELRLKSAECLDELIVALTKAVASVSDSQREKAYSDCLSALMSQCGTALMSENHNTSVNATSIEIHDRALATLERFLENSGERLVAGWDVVFDLINSCFENDVRSANTSKVNKGKMLDKFPRARSAKLLRSSFRSLQLVGSDFCALLPAGGCTTLVDVLSFFGRQESDMNISLTIATMYWDTANFVQGRLSSAKSTWGCFSTFDEISEEAILSAARNENQDGWLQALWLYLLSSLAGLTADERLDVRNSALRVLFRIFEAYGQFLSSTAWQYCLDAVLLETFERQTVKLRAAANANEIGQWEESLVSLNEGLGRLLQTFILTIMERDSSLGSWDRLFKIQASQLQQKPSIRLFSSVYGFIVEVLGALKAGGMTDSQLLDAPHRLWKHSRPSGIYQDAGIDTKASENDTSKRAERPNEQATLAFIDAFVAIYTFTHPAPPFVDPSGAMDAIQEVIFNCSHAYTNDIENPSPEQTRALFVLPKLFDAFQPNPADFMKYLFRFAEAFLDGVETSAGRATFTVRRPSYLAFSISSVGLIETLIVQKSRPDGILEKFAVPEALDCLSRIINFKHVEFQKGNTSLTWKAATKAAVAIVEHVVSVSQRDDQTPFSKFYDAANRVFETTTFTIKIPKLAVGDYLVNIPDEFDVEALKRLHSAIIPAIGRANVSDKARRNYARTLFIASLVHRPKRNDLPSVTDLLENPLAGLYHIRPADVIEPIPTERLRISYAAFDALFDLISSSSDGERDNRRILIAKAAAPYAVLRAALPLKAFIADQPVGANLPIPTTIIDELTTVMNKAVSLKSEDAAIPAAFGNGGDGTTSNGKRHLGHLYPIFVEFVETLRVLSREVREERLWEASMQWLGTYGNTRQTGYGAEDIKYLG